jgi:hypothetical protein
MKAYFHKKSITPCLYISTNDETVSLSIGADDSCGRMPHYGRFSVWFTDTHRGIDECEDELNLSRVISFLGNILLRDK